MSRQEPNHSWMVNPYRNTPARVTTAYVVFALGWIWLTDGSLRWAGGQTFTGFWLAAGKGTAFVVLTAALLYGLLRRELRRHARTMGLLHVLTQQTTDAVFVKDLAGRYLLFNEAAARFVGKSVGEVLGKDDTTVFDAASAARVMAQDRRVIASGVSESTDHELTASGVTRIYHANKTPYRDPTGNVIGVIGFSRDVTEMRRATAALREREAFARAVLDSVPARLAVLDPGGVILAVNELWQAACASGETTDGLVGGADVGSNYHAVCERLPPPAGGGTPVADGIRAVLAGRSDRFTLDYPTQGTAGRQWFHISVTRLSHGSGGVVVAQTDVTDRKRMEEELRASESRYRTLVEHTADAFFLHTADGRVIDVNRRTCESLDYTREELIGQMPMTFDPQVTSEILAGMLTALDAGRVVSVDSVHRRKDGTTFPVEVRVRPFSVDGVRYGLAIVRDITERKRVEESLRLSEERLRLALRGANGGVWDWDTGPAAWWSPEMYDLWGIAPRPVMNMDDRFPLIHPDDRERVRRATAAAMAGPSDYRVEFRIRHPARGERWLSSHGQPHAVPGGRRLIGITLDVTDHRAAEELLRTTEARLSEAQRIARIGSWWWEPPTDRVWWSEFIYELFGLDPTAVAPSYESFLAVVHPADRPTAVERVEAILAGATGFDSDVRIVRPDAGIIWVRSQARATRDDAGALIRVEGTDQDITERKRVERALRDSEERYRRLVDVLPEALFIHAGNRITFCNPAFVRMLGAGSAAEVLGKAPAEIAHPDDRDSFASRLAALSETDHPAAGVEARVVRLDGREVPVHLVSTRFSENGEPASLVALSDLTERERSTELLRSVLGSVNDGIVTITRAGIIRSANQAAERLFGYPEAALVGKNVNMLMPQPFAREHDQYLVNYLTTGVPKVIGTGREIEGLRQDNSRFPAELTVTEFRLDGERHFTGVVRDITLRRRLEAQFHQAQKMEAIGRLAGGIAHDFNNLLTVIHGYCDMLLVTLPERSEARVSVGVIRDAGERAGWLTQQLLAFSRKAVIEPRTLDLNDLLSASVRLLRRLIGEDIELLLVPDPACPRVKADPGQLEQCIMNLVVNARDAMPTGGKLTLATRAVMLAQADVTGHPGMKPGRYARVTISDTGCGMTDEVKGKVFEPFFTTKGVGKGTGLGLAVVHGAVEHCGGKVDVDSTVGAGTTFSLYFPESKAEAAAPALAALPTSHRGSETILLVEDEGAVREIVRLTLESQGYTVLAAENGAAAVELTRSHQGTIHLLVTDVVMPDIGGRRLAELIRAERPGVRVLFVSGYTDDAVLHHGVEETTDAFLQKPFTPLGLAKKVRAVIDAAG